jgi:tellurite resistance protein TehA-like permease
MSLLVILLLRLVLHKLPDHDMAASGWLALGPIGTAALGLLLGGDALAVFAVSGLSGVGQVAFSLGIIGGTMLWGYGSWWLLLAILMTWRYLRDGMPFNLGCWGMTFPLGPEAPVVLGGPLRLAQADSDALRAGGVYPSGKGRLQSAFKSVIE